MDRDLRACLRGKRIVWLGDSTCRFEYLTVAVFAEWGVLPDSDCPRLVPPCAADSLVGIYDRSTLPRVPSSPSSSFPRPPRGVHDDGCASAGGSSSWNHFFQYSSRLLRNETCDCWRAKAGYTDMVENRIYRGGDAGPALLAYFGWYGDQSSPQGHGDPTQLAHSQFCSPGRRGPRHARWQMPADMLLRCVLRHLRPTHLVVGTGPWSVARFPPAFWRSLALAGALAVQRSAGRAYWRVTPRWPGMSAAERAAFIASRERYIRTTLDEPDTSPLRQAGWRVHDAQAAVRDFEAAHGSRGRNASEEPTWHAFLDDRVHASPLANAAIVRRFLRDEVCRPAARAPSLVPVATVQL